MKALAFGMLTSGYTIVAAVVYWVLSRCGSGGCVKPISSSALVFAVAAVLVYVLASLLFWNWRPFEKDRNVR